MFVQGVFYLSIKDKKQEDKFKEICYNRPQRQFAIIKKGEMTMKKRLLTVLLVLAMLVQGMVFGGVSAETTEKVVADFAASNIETTRVLYGYMFYTDWKTGTGLPGDAAAGVGADASGSAANGAHKKMYLKSTVTLTALDESVDVTTCWKNVAFRLRSGKVGGAEQAANFYNVTPDQVTMVNGSFEVSIPLSEI